MVLTLGLIVDMGALELQKLQLLTCLLHLQSLGSRCGLWRKFCLHDFLFSWWGG